MSRESRFLSMVLRHKPEEVDLRLGPGGWVEIEALLAAMKRAGRRLKRSELEEIVATNEKKRSTISDDGLRIRAAQGHSVPVDLMLPAQVPAEWLYHGTARSNLDEIFVTGLERGGRQQVHLTGDVDTARIVGTRHGKPVVLKIAAGAMQEASHQFFLADNGVWLTNSVPVQFIGFAA